MEAGGIYAQMWQQQQKSASHNDISKSSEGTAYSLVTENTSASTEQLPNVKELTSSYQTPSSNTSENMEIVQPSISLIPKSTILEKSPESAITIPEGNITSSQTSIFNGSSSDEIPGTLSHNSSVIKTGYNDENSQNGNFLTIVVDPKDQAPSKENLLRLQSPKLEIKSENDRVAHKNKMV